ncbi:PREDICTED: lysM and putative peptidoglycan-binding domain-containing protein 2 isoform X2 [Nicrophorus vespilloides]|nr:PREDICTED: lysM and putative peptidoglycan-binding domain-containing protein 2 isoform X2 [Nicrophorus vespilloides]
MDDRHSYEKLSIRDSARYSKKYGSTSSRNNTRNESFVKHIVTGTDTLQGLALKYGVTMEQIRRANRLFASDSLFLREHLLIPVPEGYNGGETPTTQLVDIPVSPDANSDAESSGGCGITSSAASSQVTSPASYDNEDVAEFLVKIDAAIANTKADVKKIHKNSEFSNFDCGSERRKPAVSRMKQMVNNNGTSDILKTPQAVVMTQGNKIKTSMRRYQQQQDELFEL